MDLHWDTSVDEKPLCTEGWLIMPITVQKEFKPLCFYPRLLSFFEGNFTSFGPKARPVLFSPVGDQKGILMLGVLLGPLINGQ